MCDDGSIYIGDTPDGGGDLYATTAAHETTTSWNDGGSDWVDLLMANCQTGCTGAGAPCSPGDVSTCWTGQQNTADLVATTGAQQPYEAAEYCDGLSAHGHSDWYLPAQDELNLFWNGGTPLASVQTDGTWYWSSSERSTGHARIQRFSDGYQYGEGKDTTQQVRCVRRDGITELGDLSCTTDQIAQYDGTSWVCADNAGLSIANSGQCVDGAGMYYDQASSSIRCDPCAGDLGAGDEGTVWAGGSIYIGDTPDGGGDLYATTSAHETNTRWAVTSGYDLPMANCTDASPGTASACQTGQQNTADLVATTGADEPYEAAEYCDGLTNVHGKSDWYLPAQDELNLFWNGGTPLASVLTDGTYYWSSSERDDYYARVQRFSDGDQSNDNKSYPRPVRCVRRD